MTQRPELLDQVQIACVENTRVRNCAHGLVGFRVRADLHGQPDDACVAARGRVLDHASIWKPVKGGVEDQVLISRVYADDRQKVAIDTAIYAAGFNAVWSVIPADDGCIWVILARSDDSKLFQALDSLPGATGEEIIR
jgi:hypothetical protein